MRFKPDFKRWHFSTKQFIETEEYQDIMADYHDFQRSMLKVDIRDMNREMYGTPKNTEDASTSSKVRNTVLGVLFIAAFICMILALVLKQLLVFGIIFTSLFFIAGGILAFTGQADPGQAASKKFRSRIIGIFIMLGSVAVLSLILLRDRFSQGELLVWMASALFGLSGLGIITIAIVDKLSAKIIYKEEIDAKCVGYVRMADSENDTSSKSMPRTYMYISPVFEYFYNGEKIKAVYDTFPIGDYSDIALDTSAKIRINPAHPEDIMSPHVTKSSSFVALLIFGLLFAGVGSGLAWFSLLGGTKDLTVETSWNNLLPGGDETSITEPAKIQLTDEMIESKYNEDINGMDWYVEKTPVKATEDYEGNLLLTFDDAFEKMLVSADTGIKAGDELYIFYTVSFENEGQTEGYKSPFVYTKPSEIEYTGTHGAYKPS